MSCGQGVQRRNVGCQMGTHKVARETECNPYTRPESERACQAPQCPLYAWRAEEWQEVSRAMKWAPARHFAQPPCYHHIRSFPCIAFKHGDKAGSFPKDLLSEGKQFTPTRVGELLLFMHAPDLNVPSPAASGETLIGLGPNAYR